MVLFYYSENCVIDISKDNCSFNEPALFIVTVSACSCCGAAKLHEWLKGKLS
jgi:hypothetical protein